MRKIERRCRSRSEKRKSAANCVQQVSCDWNFMGNSVPRLRCWIMAHREQGIPLWGFSQRTILVLLLIFATTTTTITKAGRSFLDLSKAVEQRNDRECAH